MLELIGYLGIGFGLFAIAFVVFLVEETFNGIEIKKDLWFFFKEGLLPFLAFAFAFGTITFVLLLLS